MGSNKVHVVFHSLSLPQHSLEPTTLVTRSELHDRFFSLSVFFFVNSSFESSNFFFFFVTSFLLLDFEQRKLGKENAVTIKSLVVKVFPCFRVEEKWKHKLHTDVFIRFEKRAFHHFIF